MQCKCCGNADFLNVEMPNSPLQCWDTSGNISEEEHMISCGREWTEFYVCKHCGIMILDVDYLQ